MSINLTVVIDNDEAIRKFRELQKTAKTVTSNVVTDADRMDIAMRRFATTLGQIGIGVSLTGLIRQIALTRGEFQQLEVAFTTLLQSKEKADALMSQMVELAAKTPFDLQGVANGARQLLAYGFAAEDVTDVLTRLGNVAAGLGLNLQDLTWLYGTTAVQGRLYTRDVMQFQSRGIDLAGELATQLGKTRAEISQMVTEGKIGFPEVQKAIENMTNEGGKFYNLMQEQSKTITGLISNLGDAIDMMFNDIGKSQEGVITSVLQGTISLVENYQKVLDIVTQLVIAYGTYKTALIVLTTAEKLRYQAALAHGAGLTTLQVLTDILTAKTKALNKALLSNPYVLAAAAAAALAVVIYNLVTAKSAEERAMENVNKAIDEYNQKLDEQKSKAEQLHSVMQDDVSTAYSKQKAYQDLIRLYPELLEKYSEEEIKLISLIDLTKELNRINDTRKGDNLQEQYDTTLEKVRKLKQAITDAAKNGTLSAGYYTLLAKDLRNAEADLDEYRNKLDEFYKTKKAAEWANTPVEIKVATLQGNIKELKDQNKEIGRLIEEAKKDLRPIIPYDESEDYYEAIIQSNLKKIANKQSEISSLQSGGDKATIQNKSYWENLKKEAVASLEAMDASLKGTAKWNELVAKIAKYDANIKQYSVSSKTEAAAVKARKKLSDSLVQAELDLQSRSIAVMRDGKNKRLAEIDLEYQQTVAKINQNRRDKAKEGATDDDLSVYDQQMTAAEQKRLQDRAHEETKYAKQTAETYRQLADVFLTEEERKTRAIEERYRKMRRELLDKFLGGDIGVGDFLNITALINKAEKQETVSDLLQKYQSYTDKRIELERRFDEEEKTLLANRTAENAETVDRSLNELNRRRAKELAEVDSSVQASSGLWSRLFDTYSSYTNKQLREIIAHAQQVLDYVNNTEFDDISPRFGMSVEQLQNLKTNASDLSAAYDALGGKLELLDKQNPFGAMIRSSQLLKKNTAEVEKAERELAKAQASGDKQVINDAQKKLEGLQRQQALLKGGLKSAAQAATSYLGEVGDSLQRIGEAAGDANLASFGKALSEVSGIAEKFISGDISGGVISTITTGLSAIFSSQAKYRAALKQMHDDQIAFAHEYRLLLSDIRLEAEGASNAFSDDVFAKAIASLKEMSDLYKNFIDQVNKDEGIQASRQGPLGKIQQIKQKIRGINTDLQNIWIQTRHGTWFRSAKGEYLKDLYPELFEGPEELGGFNVEAARALLETNNQLNDEAKRQLQEVVDLHDQWQEAEDQFKEYLNSTFGEIGDSLGDSIVEAFKNGTDAMEAWRQSFNNVLEKVGKQMMQTLFFQKYFDQLEADLTQLYTDYGDDPNVLATKIPELLGTFFGGMDDVVGEAETWWKTWNEKAKEYGFDLLGNDTEKQSATSRGFQAMSQDTGDELNGRFSDIQGKMSILVSGVDKLSSLGLETKNEIVNMRDIMIQLNGNVADIRTYTKVLPQMSATLISMDRKLNNL